LNLLSEGIVRPDGSPGRHFAAARQFTTSGRRATSSACSKGKRLPTRLWRRRPWAEPRIYKARRSRRYRLSGTPLSHSWG
jgi:hypothetical protein